MAIQQFVVQQCRAKLQSESPQSTHEVHGRTFQVCWNIVLEFVEQKPCLFPCYQWLCDVFHERSSTRSTEPRRVSDRSNQQCRSKLCLERKIDGHIHEPKSKDQFRKDLEQQCTTPREHLEQLCLVHILE